jgi:hypothetical protein
MNDIKARGVSMDDLVVFTFIVLGGKVARVRRYFYTCSLDYAK